MTVSLRCDCAFFLEKLAIIKCCLWLPESVARQLSLAGAFYEEDIVYTYEQYREHLEMMKRFSQMHKNYHIEENKSPAFRHIQILIHEGSWAIVSKEKTPAIHFVIRHPKMREAMENITMPIVEGEEYK